MFLGFDICLKILVRIMVRTLLADSQKVFEAIQSTCILEIKHMSGLR